MVQWINIIRTNGLYGVWVVITFVVIDAYV